MNFINLFVEKEYAIRVNKNRLELIGEETHYFPLEDLGVIMLENGKCTTSVYALEKITAHGAIVMICNEKHLPVAQVVPCNDYYKPLKRYKLQQEISKPRLKNLWKEIIKAKVENQADCLARTGNTVGKLKDLITAVRSGDPDNVEGQAAAYYFPQLFGSGFIRDEENEINSALNYTYAIVRGIIARQISARGLLPCVGIFHKNEYNAFNLADDLIEPFRPIVDFFVYSHRAVLINGLTPSAKKSLFAIVNLQVISGEERHSLAYAVEREVESIISYYEGADKLLFPKIDGLVPHEYE